MSCGLINSLANLLGFVFVLALTPFLDTKTVSSSLTSMIVLLGSLVIAIVLFVISSFVRVKNRKNHSVSEK